MEKVFNLWRKIYTEKLKKTFAQISLFQGFNYIFLDNLSLIQIFCDNFPYDKQIKYSWNTAHGYFQ